MVRTGQYISVEYFNFTGTVAAPRQVILGKSFKKYQILLINHVVITVATDSFWKQAVLTNVAL